jgi:hypothetical protein
VDLHRASQHLRDWTYTDDDYIPLDGCEPQLPDFPLSYDAKNYIRRWIHTHSSLISLSTTDENFSVTTNYILRRMKDAVKKKRIVFWCVDSNRISCGRLLRNRTNVGHEITALALVYSCICQIIDKLPNDDSFQIDGKILELILDIDGTVSTLEQAIGGMSLLLEALGDESMLVVGNAEHLHGDSVSNMITYRWLKAVNETNAKVRVWISQLGDDECVYKGEFVKRTFSLKPKRFRRTYTLEDSDFLEWKYAD